MLRITSSSTVEDARHALTQLGQQAIVVSDKCTPIGVVTDADLSSQVTRLVFPGALVVDVMSHECVPLDPAAELLQTLRGYTDAAWASTNRRRPLSPDTLERKAATIPAAPKEEPCHSCTDPSQRPSRAPRSQCHRTW